MADITHGGTPVVGDTAHDAVDSGRPIKVGGKAATSLPTAVSTNDRVDAVWTTQGALTIAGVSGTTPTGVRTNASGSLAVTGGNAHDDPDVGAPVKIGGKAHTSLPTAVANNDRVNMTCTTTGGQVMAGVNGTTPVNITANGSGTLSVQGGTVHDAVDAGNPLKIGGRASTDEPTAVAIGDRVNAWFDTFGRLVTVPGHANPELPSSVTASASGTTAVLNASGAGVSHYIQKVNLMNTGSAKITVELRDGATKRWRGTLAADGGGTNLDFGNRGWKLTANTALNIALFAAGTVEVNVLERYLAA